MSGSRKKIDTSIPPYMRPRREYWPDDWECREYFSSVIPEFYDFSGGNDGISGTTRESKEDTDQYYGDKRWVVNFLIQNDRILKAHRESDPDSPEDRRRALIDARVDQRESDKFDKQDRRDAAIDAGDCSAAYTGNCKDECRGKGLRGACCHCSGQVIKAGGTAYTKLKNRHTSSGGARQSRSKPSHAYDGPPE